jgi:hypothetical protein
MDTAKPSRRTSKRLTWSTWALAWATLWLSMIAGDGMAAIVVPTMVGLILLVSGVYMGVGHADLRVMHASASGRAAAAETVPVEEVKP